MNAYLISQIPTAAAIVLLFIISAVRPRRSDGISLFLSVLAIFGTIPLILNLHVEETFFGGAVTVYQHSRAFAVVLLVLFGLGVLLSAGYTAKTGSDPVDFRLLVVLMASGAVHLTLAGDLGTFFIAFELVSIPAYALAGFLNYDGRSNEAGIKYLILGVIASALLMAGFVLLYGLTGTLHMGEAAEKMTALAVSGNPADKTLARLSVVLVFAALALKSGAAPFHGWLLDVYQGTPLSSLAIVASPVKVATFAALYSMMSGPFGAWEAVWIPLAAGSAVLSFLAGGVQGLTQSNVKRILACSSVANAGFIVLATAVSGQLIVFYSLVYGFSIIGILAALMSLGTARADIDTVSDLRGTGASARGPAVAVTILLVSIAGVPLTAGFAAKLGVLYGSFLPTAGVLSRPLPASQLLLVAAAAGVLLTVLSFAYYFRLLREIWFEPGHPREYDQRWNYRLVAVVTAVATLALGFMPGIAL